MVFIIVIKLCLNFNNNKEGIVNFKFIVLVYIWLWMFFCIYLLERVLFRIMLINEDNVIVIVDIGLVCDIGILRFLVNRVGN